MERPNSVKYFEVAIYVGIAFDLVAAAMQFNRDLPFLRSRNMTDALPVFVALAVAAYCVFFFAAWYAARRRSNLARFSVLLFVILASFKPRNFAAVSTLLDQRDYTLVMFYILAAVFELLAIIFVFQKDSNGWFQKKPAVAGGS